MDRGAWRATVRGITKSQTWLSDTAQHRMLGGDYVVDQTHLVNRCNEFISLRTFH